MTEDKGETVTQIKYPSSARTDVSDVLHGVTVPDPYRWLEDIDSEQTQAWIAAQNELASAYLEQIPGRAQIHARLTELWNYEKYGVPRQRGGRYFYTRNNGLQNQAVLYWQESLEAEPQMLLDPNQLSEDGTVALIDHSVSKDGRLLAYGLSASGSDWIEWRVRQVDSGQDLDDCVQWSKFSGAAWTPDNQGFYYSRYDAPQEGLAYKGANYYQKLYYHRVGTPQSEDKLVYERPDHKEWGFGGQVSEDGRYLVISVWMGTHRENGVFYQDLEQGGQVISLLQSFDAKYEFVGNDGPLFCFMTDYDAPMSRAIAIDVNAPERANWREIIPASEDALQSVSLVGDKFIACYMNDAHSRVKVLDKSGALLRELQLPGIGSVEGFESNQASRETFYLYKSFTTPETIYHYDVETGRSALFRQPRLDFDPDAYVTEQVFYPSKDGTRVPMFISYKKGLQRNGDKPTYLYGYGGFDIAQPPNFSVENLAWMERGGIYALANLRGGSEYGKPWHEAGMKLNKQNVFDDFIAAAEWLIEKGYTSTPRLAIAGRSNGGLLIGACLTQRPDLFGACLPAVGVLDMLRFHKFTIGWAWVSDYGSPEDLDEFQALLAYSPYHNLRPGTAYPATLVQTGDHDDRVFPAHSFKFAAALQAAQSGPTPALIKIATKAGHGMGKPTDKLIEDAADRGTFLTQALRMDVD
jgi:prolyl oligopeptidase